MFSVNASTLVFVKAIAGASFVELYHERLHVVKFEVRLAFRASVNCGEDRRIVEVDVTVGAIFFMGGNARFIPFSSSDVAFMLCILD